MTLQLLCLPWRSLELQVTMPGLAWALGAPSTHPCLWVSATMEAVARYVQAQLPPLCGCCRCRTSRCPTDSHTVWTLWGLQAAASGGDDEDVSDGDDDDDDTFGDDAEREHEMELNELQEEDARILSKIETLLAENNFLSAEEVDFIRRSTLLGLDTRFGE